MMTAQGPTCFRDERSRRWRNDDVFLNDSGRKKSQGITMTNHFGSAGTLQVGDKSYTIFRLAAVAKTIPAAARLPFSLKVLLENLLRTQNDVTVRPQDVEALARWPPQASPNREIAFTPARVLLQDFTGVPAIVDLAAMRDAM